MHLKRATNWQCITNNIGTCAIRKRVCANVHHCVCATRILYHSWLGHAECVGSDFYFAAFEKELELQWFQSRRDLSLLDPPHVCYTRPPSRCYFLYQRASPTPPTHTLLPPSGLLPSPFSRGARRQRSTCLAFVAKSPVFSVLRMVRLRKKRRKVTGRHRYKTAQRKFTWRLVLA